MDSKAKESAQVRKYRRKLKKQLDTEHAMMNEVALKKVKETIQTWISRHQNQRISFQEKAISLFDENKHSAPTESKFVQGLFSQLREQFKHEDEEKRSLQGRISSV